MRFGVNEKERCPGYRTKIREIGVAVVVIIHHRQQKFIGYVDRLTEDLPPSDDEYLFVLLGGPDRRFDGSVKKNSGMMPARIAGNHDVRSIRKRGADRQKCFVSHQDSVAGGKPSESFQVIGNVPRYRAKLSDDMAVVQCSNQDNFCQSDRLLRRFAGGGGRA